MFGIEILFFALLNGSTEVVHVMTSKRAEPYETRAACEADGADQALRQGPDIAKQLIAGGKSTLYGATVICRPIGQPV